MMTSLKEQLSKLAVPVTGSFEVDVRHRKSLLYEDASKIDTTTCYQRSRQAFELLCKIDVAFSEFAENLFTESSCRHEPSMITKEERAELDRVISRFLTLISFRVMEPTALKALDWLIYKYEIHLHNVDDSLRCFFPIHDIALFPKFLQLLDLKSHHTKSWHWLKPYADSGIPLTVKELVRVCYHDVGMVLFIANCVQRAVKHVGHMEDSAARLYPVVNFFTRTVVAVCRVQPVDEERLGRILSHLQDPLRRCLRSKLHTCQSMALVAALCFAAKLRLSRELVSDWIGIVLKRPAAGLEIDAAMAVSRLLFFQKMDLPQECEATFEALRSQITEPDRALLDQLELERIETSVTARLGTSSAMDCDEEIEVNDEADHLPAGTGPASVGASVKNKPNPIELDSTSPNLSEEMEKLVLLNLLNWVTKSGKERSKFQLLRGQSAAVGTLRAIKLLVFKDKEPVWPTALTQSMTRLPLVLLHPLGTVRRPCFRLISRMASKFKLAQLIPLTHLRSDIVYGDPEYIVSQSPYNQLLFNHCCNLLTEKLDTPPNTGQLTTISAILRLLSADTVTEPSTTAPWWPAFTDLVRTEGPLQLAAVQRIGAQLFEIVGAEGQRSLLEAMLAAVSHRVFPTLGLAMEKLNLTVEHYEHCLKLLDPHEQPSKKKSLSARIKEQKKLKEGQTETPDQLAPTEQATPDSAGSEERQRLAQLEVLLHALLESSTSGQLDKAGCLALVPRLITQLDQRLTWIQSHEPISAVGAEDDDGEVEGSGNHLDNPDLSGQQTTTVSRLLACTLAICKLYHHKKIRGQQQQTWAVDVDPILRCLTVLVDKQIHHQVLIIISHLAELYPSSLVQNLMPLVTWLGRSLVPLDDHHSLTVLSRLVFTAIPAFVRASPYQDRDRICVLSIFAKCCPDIPHHRRLVFYTSVIEGLDGSGGGEGHRDFLLWALILLLFNREGSRGVVSDNFLGSLLCKFPTASQLLTWTELLRFLRYLATSQPDPAANRNGSPAAKRRRCDIGLVGPIQVPSCSPDSHGRIVNNVYHRLLLAAMTTRTSPSNSPTRADTIGEIDQCQLSARAAGLLLAHLSSSGHLTQLATESSDKQQNEEGLGSLHEEYRGLFEEAIELLLRASARSGGAGETAVVWQTVADLVLKTLMLINHVVPTSHFLEIISSLLTTPNQTSAVQRKSLDLLTGRLAGLPTPPTSQPLQPDSLELALSKTLEAVVQFLPLGTTGPTAGGYLHQVALVCSKELARLLIRVKSERFIELAIGILKTFTTPNSPCSELSRKRSHQSAIAASDDADGCGSDDPKATSGYFDCRSLACLFLAECVTQLGATGLGVDDSDWLSTILGLGLEHIEMSVGNAAAADGGLVPKVRREQHLQAGLTLLASLVTQLHTRLTSSHLTRLLRVIFLVGDLDLPSVTRASLEKQAATFKRIAVLLSRIRTELAVSLESHLLLSTLQHLIDEGLKSRQWSLVSGGLALLGRQAQLRPANELQMTEEVDRSLFWSLLLSCLSTRETVAIATADDQSDSCSRITEALESVGLLTVVSWLTCLEPEIRERLACRLFEWSRDAKEVAARGQFLDRQIAYFRLIARLSAKLNKEDFSDLVRKLDLVDHITRVFSVVSRQKMRACRKSKQSATTELAALLPLDEATRCHQLLVAMLDVVRAFVEAEHDTASCLEVSDSIVAMVTALASLLETADLGPFKERCEGHLCPCLTALVNAIGGDEALLRPLSHALCLRSKSSDWRVRLWSVRCVRLLYDQLGEVFVTSLLGEALPYLTEAAEDEHRAVARVALRLCDELPKSSAGTSSVVR